MTHSLHGLRAGLLLSAAALALGGCLGNGNNAAAVAAAVGGVPVATPVNNLQGTGRLLAASFNGTTTRDPASGGINRTRTSSASNERTAAGGVALTVTVDDDPGSTDDRDVLLTATSGNLSGGTVLPQFTNEPTQVQLALGRFGDPQTFTSAANAGDPVIATSTVSILTPTATTGIDLDDVTTFRYWAGINQTGTENYYGVGFYGNPTPLAAVPANATYTALLEGAEGDFSFENGSTASVTVTPGSYELAVNGALVALNGATLVNPNANVTGLRAQGVLVGSEVNGGTVRFVDAGGATVGTVTASDLIAGLFGPTGSETAAALNIEGTMDLNGNPNTPYFYSTVVIGER